MTTISATDASETMRIAPFWPTVGTMAQRNLTRFVRIPAIVLPMVVMPVFFVVAFTDNIVNWVAAFAMLQGASFAGVGTAGAMANDLETGFIDRLLVSPIRRSAILVAPLVYTVVRAVIPLTMVVLIAAFFQGLDIQGGVLGVVLAYVGGIGGALVFGAFGLAVVLRIGNTKAMAIVQMFSFLLMFPSIGQVPITLLTGWMHQFARFNPVTNVLRLTRQGFIGPVTWDQTWPGLLAIVVGLALTMAWASYELKRRNP
jgi:ABC-2 type transport system permease protein